MHQRRSAPARRGRQVRLVSLLVLAVGATGFVVEGQRAASTASSEVGASGALDTTLDAADGVIADGTTVSVFDDSLPAVANLDPALRDALDRAAADAALEGVELGVNSGWRSPAYQQRLLLDAVAEHGSEEEAARWVATPETSAHVSGEAVDVGPPGAAAWLSERGSAYELCQIYANEPWHFELRADADEHGCPAVYPDPTADPRMQP